MTGILGYSRASAEGEFYKHVVFLTGMSGAVTMIPLLYLYRADRTGRMECGVISPSGRKKLTMKEILLLLVTGAGLAQWGNLITAVLQMYFDAGEFNELMNKMTEGKHVLMLVLWMGIVAPVAEEVVFRWLVYLRLRDYLRTGWAAVISALAFGAYHGNWMQFVYASMLGVVFALILEKSGSLWSCVLLHIGANIWSLLLSEYGLLLVDKVGEMGIGLLYLLLLAVMVSGIAYFCTNKGASRRRRRV